MALDVIISLSTIKYSPKRIEIQKDITWNRKKRVIINRDWCKGCGICVAFCPKEVLVLDDQDKACWAYPEKCISCGLCELRCPDMATTLEENKS